MQLSKISTPVWNAEHAAAIARQARFPWRRMSAALRLSSTPCWEEQAANVPALSNRAMTGKPAKADVAANICLCLFKDQSMEYLVLALLWITFCVLHSALISATVTGYFQLKLGNAYRFYRLSYNIFSVATLTPVVIYSLSIKQEPFFVWNGYLLPVKYLLFFTGILFFILGARRYSFAQFSGLAQIKEGTNSKLLNKTGKLSSRGILSVVRHPFYSGIFPLLWAGDLDVTALITNVILSIYVLIGTMLEEHKLIGEFGDEYREYQQRVSMLFPLIWLKKKIGFTSSLAPMI